MRPPVEVLAQLSGEPNDASMSPRRLPDAAGRSSTKLCGPVRRPGMALKCKHCGKECESTPALELHENTHTADRPHGCECCDKR